MQGEIQPIWGDFLKESVYIRISSFEVLTSVSNICKYLVKLPMQGEIQPTWGEIQPMWGHFMQGDEPPMWLFTLLPSISNVYCYRPQTKFGAR